MWYDLSTSFMLELLDIEGCADCLDTALNIHLKSYKSCLIVATSTPLVGGKYSDLPDFLVTCITTGLKYSFDQWLDRRLWVTRMKYRMLGEYLPDLHYDRVGSGG